MHTKDEARPPLPQMPGDLSGILPGTTSADGPIKWTRQNAHKNPKVKEYQRGYRRKHSRKIRKYGEAYRRKNRDRILLGQKSFREANRARLRAAAKRRYYLLKDDPQRRLATNKRERRRRKTDAAFAIKGRLRCRLYDALRGKATRTSSTLLLLGCSVEHLMKHLESQFLPGMNWSNRGKWEIDHIIPCGSFDLRNPEEQQKCFHFTNLRPLWPEDNKRRNRK